MRDEKEGRKKNELDISSRKPWNLESLESCSSVLAALGMLQLQGPRLSKSRSFLDSSSITHYCMCIVS